jgi:hypothetical protein
MKQTITNITALLARCSTKFIFLFVAFAAGFVFPTALSAATYTVTNTNDSGAGSLRGAIATANGTTAADTINFAIPSNDANCTASGVCTVILTSGELVINNSSTAGALTITNPTVGGVPNLAISGNNASRVFYLNSGMNLTLNGVTVKGGNGTGTTDPSVNGNGGAILSFGGTLAVTNCLISGNTATTVSNGAGGGIYNYFATITITNSTISGNSTPTYAGGILNYGTMIITNSTVSGNTASGSAGIDNINATITLINSVVSNNVGPGISNIGGPMTMTNSTVSGNSGKGIFNSNASLNGVLTLTNSTVSNNGGTGIDNSGGTTLMNSTVSGNSSGTGGIFNSGTLTLTNSTVSGNSAGFQGGGIYSSGSTSNVNIRNTIIAGNTATNGGPDIYYGVNGNFQSNGNNLIGNSNTVRAITWQTSDILNQSAQLAPLGNYGGVTLTRALLANSPAINAGNNCVLTVSGCGASDPPTALTTDQRGFARNGQVDIGAFEYQGVNVYQTIIQTSPSGRSFTVDGVTYNSAQNFDWTAGSTHTIATTSTQAGDTGTRYTWANWSDGGAISHTVTANGITTYTANFNTQYQLTMVANGSGTVSPASGGFYNAGQSVPISAMPSSGFVLFNWTGSGNGSYDGTNNPATVTMNAPITQTANFRSLCTYTISPASAYFYKNGGNRSFNVTDSNGCGWGITSNASWITASITGSTVNYTVDVNNEGAPRTGTITILPGLTFTVNQSNLRRQPQFDFDGDSKTDISIFRPSNGQWWINRSSTGQTTALQFGASTDKTVPADFSGDGKTDLAIYRPSTGEWFILRSEDNSFYSFPFGTSGDIPLVGDFDGDGKSDPTVFRPSTREWFVSKSTGGYLIVTFGLSGDQPVLADYDGDGRTDFAIYRPSSGQWWISRSSTGAVYAFQFGVSTDKPVQGDYTGDGKADTAIFRPSTGEWFILRSEDNSFYSVPFGISTDLPTPGDYDGDGKSDTAVFRPSENTWYVQRSTAGILIATFGISGDKPLPNAFVP